MAVQVIGTNGTTVLASANNQGAGGTEDLNNVGLTTAGQFFMRVSGGSADTVQLYNLSFTVEDQAPGGPAITKTDGQPTAIAGPAGHVHDRRHATRAGRSTANGATVTDTFPAALTGVTWTCAASAGSSCIVRLRLRQHQRHRQPACRRDA